MKVLTLLLLPILSRALIKDSNEYDFVVIGGGPAGLAVASRLSENPRLTVVLLEAGPNAEGLPEVIVPGLAGSGQSSTTLNWAYETTSQLNMNGRTTIVRAGKVLGGGTAINTMLFPRAGKSQYDAWAQINNDPSWSWDALLPFFKRSETVVPPTAEQIQEGDITFDAAVHGTEGRVHVGYPNFFFPQSKLWREAALRAGLTGDKDLSSGDPKGVGVTVESINVANYTRCSAVCAYYTPFSSRPNLHVITNATASRIIWDDSHHSQGLNERAKSLRAVGVEYFVSGSQQKKSISVLREVVVSAGTIGTPKILELSGVGNASILTAAGVKPMLNLPSIGENFADHVHSLVSAFTNASLTFGLLGNPEFLAEQMDLWSSNRTGILSSIPGSLGLVAPLNIFNETRLRSLVSAARENIPFYADAFANGNPLLARGIREQHRIVLGLYEKDDTLPLEISLFPGYAGRTPASQRPPRNFTTVMSVLYSPLSRGRIHITSSNASVPPSVDPAYYSHPLDTITHAAGIRLARKTLVGHPMDSIFLGEFEPGVDVQSEEEIISALKNLAFSDSHPTGSMSMMPRELGGVVDTKLKIYGTDNVRVADASIIPIPIGAHISSTVYMIGEKAADIIQKDIK
ncbi:hypothetical protein ONZ45_g9651 [Pleurotus djamor]|nr:hypothetical protein ONZ45_g9651 [Pleurotus djamor]